MARFKNGLFGGFSGAIGPVESYMLNGQLIIRSRRPKSTKPATYKQLACRAKMKMISEVLGHMTPFLNVGFAGVTKRKPINPYNAAVAVNMQKAIMGEFPDYQIDYTKLQVSAGPAVLQDLQPQISLQGNTLQYHWKNPAEYPGTNAERAMLLAYAPVIKEVVYNLCGNMRGSETDFLNLPHTWQNKMIHSYIAFRHDFGPSTTESVFCGTIG